MLTGILESHIIPEMTDNKPYIFRFPKVKGPVAIDEEDWQEIRASAACFLAYFGQRESGEASSLLRTALPGEDCTKQLFVMRGLIKLGTDVPVPVDAMGRRVLNATDAAGLIALSLWMEERLGIPLYRMTQMPPPRCAKTFSTMLGKMSAHSRLLAIGFLTRSSGNQQQNHGDSALGDALFLFHGVVTHF